jgi:hypothetical protein
MLSLNNEANNPERLISFFSDESQGVVCLSNEKRTGKRERNNVKKKTLFLWNIWCEGILLFEGRKEGAVRARSASLLILLCFCCYCCCI